MMIMKILINMQIMLMMLMATKERPTRGFRRDSPQGNMVMMMVMTVMTVMTMMTVMTDMIFVKCFTPANIQTLQILPKENA